jgi:scaffold Nfu/NifU family protein
MGQPITVTQKPTTRDGVVRFELNRSLTGMAHEHYGSAAAAAGDRPPDVLARRLFEHEAVKSVHIYSNEVTVELEPSKSGDGLKEAIEGLFIHYLPGVTPSIPAE